MSFDGGCPECGSEDYHRDGSVVRCNGCAYAYKHTGDKQ